MKTMRFSMVLIILMIVFASGCTSQQTGNQTTIPAQQQNTQLADNVATNSLTNPVKYTAEYNYSSVGRSYVMTQIYDLPKYVTITKTDYGYSKTIYNGNEIITCSSDSKNKWTCYNMTAPTPVTVDMGNKIASGSVKPNVIGTCSRAGETGTKYETTFTTGKATMCYTSDGILLEMTQPGVSMFALSVSRSIDQNEFIPPVAPQVIPV